MCLAVALAFCSHWQGWPRGHVDEPVTRTRHWLVSRSRTGGCVLAQPEAVLEQRLPQVRVGRGCGLWSAGSSALGPAPPDKGWLAGAPQDRLVSGATQRLCVM